MTRVSSPLALLPIECINCHSMPNLDDIDESLVNVEARMMLFAAIEKVRLKEFKRAGMRQVKVLSSGRDDVCNTCKKDAGEIYPIGSAPELPHVRWTCGDGYACILIASL